MRLYFRASSVAQVSPTFPAGWTNTTGASRNLASQERSSSDTLANGTARTWTSGDMRLDRFYITGPMPAGIVLTGTTVTAYLRPFESNADDNAVPAFSLHVFSEDGATERIELLAVDSWAGAELATTTTNRNYVAGEELPTYVTVHGDRLAFGIGFTDAGGASPSATGVYGSSAATDVAANEVGTDAFNPWIEFSAALSFTMPGAVTPEPLTPAAWTPAAWTPTGWGQ